MYASILSHYCLIIIYVADIQSTCGSKEWKTSIESNEKNSSHSNEKIESNSNEKIESNSNEKVEGGSNEKVSTRTGLLLLKQPLI